MPSSRSTKDNPPEFWMGLRAERRSRRAAACADIPEPAEVRSGYLGSVEVHNGSHLAIGTIAHECLHIHRNAVKVLKNKSWDWFLRHPIKGKYPESMLKEEGQVRLYEYMLTATCRAVRILAREQGWPDDFRIVYDTKFEIPTTIYFKVPLYEHTHIRL